MAAKPPRNLPPGEGGRQKDEGHGELPEVVYIGTGAYCVRHGQVTVGGSTYGVYDNVRSRQIDVESRAPGESILLTESCTEVGNVTSAGGILVLGNLKAGNIRADEGVVFYRELEASGDVVSFHGDISGNNSISARRIDAEGSIQINRGLLSARVIRSEKGSVLNKGGDIAGKEIRAYGGEERGVFAFGGKVRAIEGIDKSECYVWTPHGSVMGSGGISTGRIFAAGRVMTLNGDLELDGNSYFTGARIGGSVVVTGEGVLYYTKELSYSGVLRPGEGGVRQVARLPKDPFFDFEANWRFHPPRKPR